MISERVKKPPEQHLIEMRSNRDAWEKKALLRAIYHRFYRLIREQLATNTDAETVELGSGIGAIKAVIPGVLRPISSPILGWTESKARMR